MKAYLVLTIIFMIAGIAAYAYQNITWTTGGYVIAPCGHDFARMRHRAAGQGKQKRTRKIKLNQFKRWLP